MKWFDVSDIMDTAWDIIAMLSIAAIVTVLILQSVGVLPRV